MASVNSSGHKYGLVYPGLGGVVWRTPDALPEDLVFRVNYLGGQMPTFALNFSRPGAQVAAQYYNFIRLGFEGYRDVQQTCQDVALHLSGAIASMGPFELLTEGRDLPVFAFRLREGITGYSVFDLAERLRQRGWQVPAYTLPERRRTLPDAPVTRLDDASHYLDETFSPRPDLAVGGVGVVMGVGLPQMLCLGVGVWFVIVFQGRMIVVVRMGGCHMLPLAAMP